MEKKKLGFGFMRLPLKDQENQESIDFEMLNKMVDTFWKGALLILIQRICIMHLRVKSL